LMNGVVYAAFGSHCDTPDYRGWVVGISSAGQITARWTDEASTDGNNSPAGAIWQSGGRLVSDQPGQMLVVSGNGITPPLPAPGTTPPTTLGESAIRLKVVTAPGPTHGQLQAIDFFSPCNAQALSDADQDIGSGAPLALPDSFGTSAHRHLLVVVGKEGPIYLLDRDHLGGFQQGPSASCQDGSGNAGDNIVDQFTLPNAPGIWATPAMWPGDGGSIYVPYPDLGNPGKLTSYKIVDNNGQPTFSLAGQSDGTFGYGSSSAIVTSDGVTSGSGLVWIVFLPDGSGVNAELRAYDPNPVGGVLQLLGSWPIGTGNKFTTPTVSAGRIYVGTQDGNIRAFGVTGQSAQSERPSRSTTNAVPGAPDREG
jgi:PQQ-like domain